MAQRTDGEIYKIYGFTFYAADGRELEDQEFDTPVEAAAAHDALDDDSQWPAAAVCVSHIWEQQRRFTLLKTLVAQYGWQQQRRRNPITGHFMHNGDKGA